MVSYDIQAIILAAGRSSRLKTGKTKLVEKICGREMILYPVEVLSSLNIPISMVVGFQKEIVEKVVEKYNKNNVTFVVQEPQLGTGHAIVCTKSTWKKENILIINGDMPLISHDIIKKLYQKHVSKNAEISFVTAHNSDMIAEGYGRVIQDSDSIKIVEAKDFTGSVEEACCVNAGIYLVKRNFLEDYIDKIEASSVTNEWYITDLIKIASDNKYVVETIVAPFDRIRGINTFQELWAAEQIKKSEIVKHWMNQGVRFSIAQNVQIDVDVEIGIGSFVDSGVQILKGSKIGRYSTVGAFSIIKESIIADHTVIHPNTIISNSIIGSHCAVGPFAHVHEKSVIQDKTIIGNFVEIKKTNIAKDSKIRHLAYLGDSKVGNNVCIGAGTITCNYDGVNKFKTIIEDGAFIGSNNTLIAPIVIGKNAFTAAGSTITENVLPDSLAIARSRQINKENYAKKLKRKDEEEIAADEVLDENVKKISHVVAATKVLKFDTI